MGQGGLASRLGTAAARRPWRTVAIGAVALVIAAPLGATAFSALDPYVFEDPGTESGTAASAIEDATGVRADGTVIVLVRSPPEGSLRTSRVEEAASTLKRIDGVVRVAGPRDPGAEARIAKDGSSAFVVGYVAADSESADVNASAEDAFAGQADVALGGVVVADEQTANQSESDLRRAEALALPLLFVLSLLFFRSLVAAALPLMLGACAIVGSLFLMRSMHEVEPLSVLSINMVTGLGFGLAIDYSLFIVSRFREELATDEDVPRALRRTLETAGRAVAFSGLTVACAMASLLVFPQQFLYSMGLGGIAVSLLCAGAALTVLPAVLALLGPRVNALAPAWLARSREATELPDEQGRWYRFSRWVMRHPAPVAIASAALLLLMASPVMRLAFVPADAELLAGAQSSGDVDAEISADYELDAAYPLIVQIDDVAADAPEVGAYRQRLAADVDGIVAVSPVRPAGDGVSLEAVSGVGRFNGAAADLVREVRSLEPPGPVRVGGIAASDLDEEKSIKDHLPLSLAILILSTTALLFLMTGSLVLPLKALVMNFLSVSAALGLAVLVFQDGRLEGLFAFSGDGGILIGIAVLIAAASFGLSTDYGVFAFSRMREAKAAGASNDEAVALALERTGRLVTSAALLFAVAMGALVTGVLMGVKETGFGVGMAVLIDATIVRALLVPALMKLLGDVNWWAPRRLRGIADRLGEAPSPAE